MNLGTTPTSGKQQTCLHSSSTMIRSHGIERQICEDCDHVSFEFSNQIVGDVDRDRFARTVDQLGSADV